MSNIIKLPRDPHEETRLLLPWYLTGKLPADERERVGAHLAGCAACRAELEDEQKLGRAISELPIGAELGWAKLQSQLDEPRRAWAVGASLRRGAPWIGWAAAAALAAFAFLPTAQQKPALYHALSAAPAAPTGDVIAIFKPAATEAQISDVLIASGARIVDGPNGADAYVLATSPAGRDRALAVLRARPTVLMAEPIDSGAPR